MTPSTSKHESHGSIKIIAIACLIFGMAWLAIGLPFFLRQLDVQRHWPRASATLRSASVIENATPNGALYKTHFEFNVDSPTGPHSAVVDGYRISSDRSKVEAEAANCIVGSQYAVRINPQDPSEIRLDVDRPLRHYFIPLIFGSIAVVFFAISGALLFFSRR
jgi:hypothetical protein